MSTYRDLELKLPDEGRVVFSSRLTRISSDRTPVWNQITHLHKGAKGRFYLAILRSSLPDPTDELKIVSEEAAFDEFIRHLGADGEIFQKMEDVFSDEQLSRIQDM